MPLTASSVSIAGSGWGDGADPRFSSLLLFSFHYYVEVQL